MMRKEGACSKCGVPCSSKWQNLKCNTCILMEANTKSAVNEASSFTPSSSIPHENVAFSFTQFGMIFGNLTFDPTTLTIPLILRGKSLLPTVKSEVFTADDDSVTQHQNHFHCGKCLKPPSTSTFQIKQEPVSEGEEDEEAAIWDVKKVKKKKRSKLPQYTLSPLARFVNQLRHASYYRRRRRRPRSVGPKYDDVLIYEKCAMYIPENEIGLGAELLSPPAVYEYSWKTMSFVAMSKDENFN